MACYRWLLHGGPILSQTAEIERPGSCHTPSSGAGAKYFFQPWLQTELLISRFYDVTPNANTWTVNLGLRVFGLTAKARREYDAY